jgi:hypothetical protein
MEKDDEAARIHEQWIGHLAKWAKAELRRRGMHMRPDGKIKPLPARSLPARREADEVYPGHAD